MAAGVQAGDPDRLDKGQFPQCVCMCRRQCRRWWQVVRRMMPRPLAPSFSSSIFCKAKVGKQNAWAVCLNPSDVAACSFFSQQSKTCTRKDINMFASSSSSKHRFCGTFAGDGMCVKCDTALKFVLQCMRWRMSQRGGRREGKEGSSSQEEKMSSLSLPPPIRRIAQSKHIEIM